MAQLADFDEDGTEILLQHYRYGYYSRVYQNVGNRFIRSFQFLRRPTNPPRMLCSSCADFDGTGG